MSNARLCKNLLGRKRDDKLCENLGENEQYHDLKESRDELVMLGYATN